MPSTFSSPIVGSAYYYRGRGTARTVCRSTGFSLLSSVQATVLELLQDVGTLPSAGGVSVTADQIGVIDGSNAAAGPGWDDMTLRGIYAFVAYSARGRSAVAPYLSAIAADIMRRGGLLSERTMKAAMWVLSSRGFNDAGDRTYGLGSPDDVEFGADTAFPAYGEIPPAPANHTLLSGAGDCTPIAEGQSAGDPITATATFGASTLLLIVAIAAGVFGIANATKAEPSTRPARPIAPASRNNPLDWNTTRIRAEKRRAS